MTEATPQDEVLTYPEAAKLLKISERTLMRLVADGKVPSHRLGGLVRFSRSELLEMIRSSRPEAG